MKIVAKVYNADWPLVVVGVLAVTAGALGDSAPWLAFGVLCVFSQLTWVIGRLHGELAEAWAAHAEQAAASGEQIELLAGMARAQLDLAEIVGLLIERVERLEE